MKHESVEAVLQSVYREIDEGDPALAYARALRLAARHSQHPGVQLTLAAAAAANGVVEPCRTAARRALELEQHARTPDPELIQETRYYLAWTSWKLWDFAQAEREVRRLISKSPARAEAWSLLASILEHEGRNEEAETADQRAAELDPGRFPLPARCSDKEFEEAISQALAALPSEFREISGEVAIVVEGFPTRKMAQAEGVEESPLPPDLLGLFTGTPRPDRGPMNPLETPGTIFLFRSNLERTCPDREALVEEITVTLWHELAHYLGFDEDAMDDLGLE